MVSKTHLMEQIEDVRDYVVGLPVGSDEYIKAQNQLLSLEKLLFEMEKSESEAERKQQEMAEEKKSKIIGNIFDGIKTVSGVVLPLVGLVWITATEKDTTFTGALRDYTKYFLPKK